MNRLTSRKRITVALIGLIALVVIGWFVQQGAAAHGRAMPPAGGSAAVWQAVPVLPDSSGTVLWRASEPLTSPA